MTKYIVRSLFLTATLRKWYCFAVVLLLARGAVASAENPTKGQSDWPKPEVCVGFDPVRAHWGILAFYGLDSPEEDCPAGYAILAHNRPSGRWGTDAARFPLEGTCCPLPQGVLTEKHTFVKEHCPENSVVTGARIDPEGDRAVIFMPLELRCTEIDTSRYVLSAETSGWSVGWISEAGADFIERLRGAAIHRTAWSSIPAGLRHAVMRTGLHSWEITGCIGRPWGSVLVARTGNKCHSLYFSEIRARNQDSMHSGEGFSVVPRCRAITDPFAENATCAADSFPPEKIDSDSILEAEKK